LIGQTRRNACLLNWDEIGSVEELGRRRMSAMGRFLEDYENGRQQHRYVCGELPMLPFDDKSFDIALCSHLLFLYTDNLSLDFHLLAVRELCRVARDVRIFPVLDANRSTYLSPVIQYVRRSDMYADEINVPYEFQKGGHSHGRRTSQRGRPLYPVLYFSRM
jgi:SAM-dependent methyltransferase